MRWHLFSGPLVLAVLVTLANVAKPATVDDTAYLLFARHIASNPGDPYGFAIFWWDSPEPAMGVLCPPVVPYWLALGVKLFGEHVGLLKLWLFPFVWLLAWALHSLLVRFARGTARAALPLLMLSPAVLPGVNLMLDVPAVALALASIELFLRACRPRLSCGTGLQIGEALAPESRVGNAREGSTGLETGATRKKVLLAALAGGVAGLAMQTKYSAFVAPAVIAWCGLSHRRLALAAVAVGVCVAVFGGWELLLVQKYGRSHFAFHASASGGGSVGEKLGLLAPLAGHLGCLAVGAGLLALSVWRAPRWRLVCVAAVWCVGFALAALLPRGDTMMNRHFSAVTLFWQISGGVWFLAVAACAGVLLFRVRKGLSIRARTPSLFLVGWLVIEVVATLGLTPFPAARRVFGVTLVMGLLAAHASGRIARARRSGARRGGCS